MSSIVKRPIPWPTIGLWVVKLFLVLVFLTTGSFKLYGVPRLVEAFGRLGFGQWFRYLTGCLEIAGAIGILVPPVAAYGGLILLGISVGAFFADFYVFNQDVIHCFVLAGLSGIVIWAHRDQLVVILQRVSPNAGQRN
jgi:putative oxidoreductase